MRLCLVVCQQETVMRETAWEAEGVGLQFEENTVWYWRKDACTGPGARDKQLGSLTDRLGVDKKK